jgi:hypothetical protein
MTAPGDATRHRLGVGSFAPAGSSSLSPDMCRSASTIRPAPSDKVTQRREHSGEAMLGPLGSIPG